jgi:hypothetical protein
MLVRRAFGLLLLAVLAVFAGFVLEFLRPRQHT